MTPVMHVHQLPSCKKHAVSLQPEFIIPKITDSKNWNFVVFLKAAKSLYKIGIKKK